ARVEQGRELLLPGVAVQRIAVDQHDGPPAPVVLVVELDVGGVLLADGDVGHVSFPSRLGGSGGDGAGVGNAYGVRGGGPTAREPARPARQAFGRWVFD